jgi:hypothetical protein
MSEQKMKGSRSLIGATEDGTKELLAVVDGYRESARRLVRASQHFR